METAVETRELVKIYDGKVYSVDQRGNYFEMRSELRRIGKNLSIKQLNALASLPDSVVKTIVLLQDMKGNIQTMQDETASNGNGDTIPVEIKPEGISDGMVNISLEYQKTKASDQGIKAPSFIITFYDLPNIDNSILDKDMRVGVILTKYISMRDLDMFPDRLERKLIKDY